jgi:hypothetical protein
MQVFNLYRNTRLTLHLLCFFFSVTKQMPGYPIDDAAADDDDNVDGVRLRL